MLSPTESLGLSGATLEGRMRRAVHHVSDATLAHLAERLRVDALANDVIYEREGEREAIRIMLRPLLAMPEQLSYVHHVCLSLVDALKQVPQLYLDDLDVRKLVAITPEERAWIEGIWSEHHQRLNPVYGRLDAVCDFTGQGWQDSLQFMEPNLSGVGGIHLGPVAEELVIRDAVPIYLAHDPELAIQLPRDQRELFVQVLIDHARSLGRKSCNICFVEPKYVHEGPDEQSVLSRHLAERHGLVAVHADPRELRVEGQEVYYADTLVDVVYRDYETRDLLALEAELGKPLDAMRLLFRQNRVVSSLSGDFDHKSCWELLTDATIAERYFSAEECRLFRRHILWTRVAGDRRTSLPHGGEGDLLEFARQHREQLVLKPNRSYGGTGVTLGAGLSQSEWESLLNDVAAKFQDPRDSWVLQTATRLPVHEFPVVGENGRVFGEPFYAVMGFAPTENGLGVVARVSQKQVVNVAQHGGMAAMLVANPPRELRVPKRTQGRAEGSAQILRAQIAEIRHLDQALGLLDWDEETMLPAAGRTERGQQLATLEGLRHNLLTSDHLGDLIEEVAADAPADERWGRELVLLRRLRRSAMALPEGLVRAFAAAKSRCLGAWEEARVADDYALFSEPFAALLTLLRERAQALAAIGRQAGGQAYDALLDEYEEGMDRARLDPVLDALRERLTAMLRAHGQPAAGTEGPLAGRRFAEAGQWALARRLLGAIGFDFARGRLDRSTHPFTMAAGFDDVRLTIRPQEDNLPILLLASLHEGGHALYDQGLAPEDRGWLLGEAPSMGLHEAQARLWENHVGRSIAFWQQCLPAIREDFGDAAAGLSPEMLHRSVNALRPSVNRVSADQLSYHLHILLRYELEQALLSGTLAVGDLPGAWNERSAALLGIRPANDREGVLQDVHWSLGMFGYFPTYTVGSLYAAQLAEAYGREHGLAEEIRRGEFGGLLAWLRRHVHRRGHRLSAEEIVSEATGHGLDAGAFFRHLESNVLPLYA